MITKEDSNTITAQAAKACDLEYGQAESLMKVLRDIIGEAAVQQDTIALPSFGKFTTEKQDETIITDRSSGKRLLLPPEITLVFTASSALRKRIGQ